MIFEVKIDLDNISHAEVTRYIELIFKLGKKRIQDLKYRKSPSGKGYHIWVKLLIPEYFKDVIDMDSFNLGIRYAFYDCYGRWKADIARVSKNEEMDRLSIYKDGKYSGGWITAKASQS